MPEELPPEADDTNFAKNKHAYFASLGMRYKHLIQLHGISGQLERSEVFGVDENGRPKRWGDPTEHCLVEAAASGVLADMLTLPAEDKEDLIQAALVHDWRKRGEIEELRGVTDPALVEVSYQKSKDDLLAHGVSAKIVGLTEAVAHTSLSNIAVMGADNSLALKEDVPVIDLAMHYIDDVTRGTQLTGLDTRMDYLDANTARYPYNEEGRAIWGGRTYFEAQREIGHLVENRLAEIAGVSDPKSLPSMIEAGIVAQINALGETLA